jgi:hypothetical protein
LFVQNLFDLNIRIYELLNRHLSSLLPAKHKGIATHRELAGQRPESPLIFAGHPLSLRNRRNSL